MAITSVTRISTGRTGSEDDKGHRRYREVYRVETDTVMGQAAVQGATGLPRRYDRYVDAGGVSDNAAVAVAIDAQPEEPDFPYQWLVNVDYTTAIWDEILKGVHSGGRGNASNPNAPPGQSNDPQNPTNRPSEIAIESLETTLPMLEDADGTIVQNSANDPFENPPDIDDPIVVLVITRNQVSYDVLGMANYWNTVNADIWFGLDPGFVKCKSITAVSQFENAYTFWKVTYRLHICAVAYYRGRTDAGTQHPAFNPQTDDGALYAAVNGWNYRDARLLDAGWRDKNNKAAKVLDNGAQPVRPKLLDGAGLFLTPETARAKYKQFKRYRAKNFSELNLP